MRGMEHAEDSLVEDAKQVVRGVCMGGADIVPGVSGGTVALILGIYERLVTAISHVDLTLLAAVRERRIGWGVTIMATLIFGFTWWVPTRRGVFHA